MKRPSGPTQRTQPRTPDHAWDTPMVQRLLATLKSDAFRDKILAMGGYTVECPGEVIPLD